MLLLVSAWSVLPISHAAADAVVVVRAMKATTVMEAFLEESSLRVEIEMGLADAPAFVNLLPDDIYDQMDLPPVPLAERLHRFCTQDLVFNADGHPLLGRLVSAEPRPRVVRDEITGEPLPVAEKDAEAVIFFKIEYPLTTRPGTITFKAPDRASPGAVASIGFVFYHHGLAANDFRYLVTGSTVDLDWEDPWYSRFRNRNLQRQYGAPMQAFLYIEAFEVRKEIIARPKDLQHWIDLGLDDATVIAAEDQPALKKAVAAFLAERSVVQIDGRPAQPARWRIDFIQRTLKATGVIDPPQDLDIMSATLGVIFIYPTTNWPQTVTMDWDLFSDRIEQTPAIATDEAGGMPSTLTRDDPTLQWRNYLTNASLPTLLDIAPPPAAPRLIIPIASAACALAVLIMAGLQIRTFFRHRRVRWLAVLALAALIAFSVLLAPVMRHDMKVPFANVIAVSDGDASIITEKLLTNIYRAFDFRIESDIYDTLERSAAGDMLDTMYTSIYKSLLVKNMNGMRVSIDRVTLIDIEIEPRTVDQSFGAVCTWNVSGSVGHWGHIHQRTSQYEARMTVNAVDSQWKLTAFEPYRQERVD